MGDYPGNAAARTGGVATTSVRAGDGNDPRTLPGDVVGSGRAEELRERLRERSGAFRKGAWFRRSFYVLNTQLTRN